MMIYRYAVTAVLGVLLTAGIVSAKSAQSGEYTEGLTPLTDLGTGTYLGSPGGLYPEGSNQRPVDHEAAGMAIALNEIRPVDADGNPDTLNGKIVMASLGMSNTTQEFSHFVPLAENGTDLNPNLVVIDTAQGGKTAFEWADPDDDCWVEFEDRLVNAGVTGKQLQVVWVKLATRKDALSQPAFPGRAQQVAQQMFLSLQTLKAKYPSVRMVYLSSRIYAGYATTQLNPEPYAYETGFAVKWVIQKQLEGKPSMAYEGEDAPLPWLSWGPYLWANGLGSDGVVGGIPGRSDGLEWFSGDLGPDGTHPSEQGREKVAGMLMEFFKADSTSIPWFLGEAEEAESEEVQTSPGESSSSSSACGLVGLDAILFLGLLALRSFRRIA